MAIAGIILLVATFGVAQGLTYPLLSFVPERQGAAAWPIGLNTALKPLGLVVSARLVPIAARRFGAVSEALGVRWGLRSTRSASLP